MRSSLNVFFFMSKFIDVSGYDNGDTKLLVAAPFGLLVTPFFRQWGKLFPDSVTCHIPKSRSAIDTSSFAAWWGLQK